MGKFGGFTLPRFFGSFASEISALPAPLYSRNFTIDLGRDMTMLKDTPSCNDSSVSERETAVTSLPRIARDQISDADGRSPDVNKELRNAAEDPFMTRRRPMDDLFL